MQHAHNVPWFVVFLLFSSYHRVPEAVAQASLPSPEMSGYKVIMEVSVLVVIVLCIGTTAALTAN